METDQAVVDTRVDHEHGQRGVRVQIEEVADVVAQIAALELDAVLALGREPAAFEGRRRDDDVFVFHGSRADALVDVALGELADEPRRYENDERETHEQKDDALLHRDDPGIRFGSRDATGTPAACVEIRAKCLYHTAPVLGPGNDTGSGLLPRTFLKTTGYLNEVGFDPGNAARPNAGCGAAVGPR